MTFSPKRAAGIIKQVNTAKTTTTRGTCSQSQEILAVKLNKKKTFTLFKKVMSLTQSFVVQVIEEARDIAVEKHGIEDKTHLWVGEYLT